MPNTLEDYKHPPWTRMHIDEVRTPRVGRICYGPAWWIVTPDDYVLFSGQNCTRPQCNEDLRVTEMLVRRCHPECHPVFVDMAYVPHECSWFVG